MEKKRVISVVVLVLAVMVQVDSKDAMKIIAKGFIKVLEECKKEVIYDRLPFPELI